MIPTTKWWLILFCVTVPLAGEQRQVRLIRSGPEFEMVKRVVTRLESQVQFKFPRDVHEIVIDDDTINASSYPDRRLIVIPVGIVRFLRDSEGELAFVIGHEMGHVIDIGLKTRGNVQSVCPSKSAAAQRFCESRADEIGLQYMAGAGYNPYDCGAWFGRWAMFAGDTGLGGLLRKWIYNQNHPISTERLADMRKTLYAYCQQFSEQCSSTR